MRLYLDFVECHVFIVCSFAGLCVCVLLLLPLLLAYSKYRSKVRLR